MVAIASDMDVSIYFQTQPNSKNLLLNQPIASSKFSDPTQPNPPPVQLNTTTTKYRALTQPNPTYRLLEKFRPDPTQPNPIQPNP